MTGWIEGFRAAERTDREAGAAGRPQPDWSVCLALSMIEAAPLRLGDPQIEELRRAADDSVRRAWDLLRARR